MNRLKVLKQNKNDSILSNASHDGYESAMDETMGSTQSASMYFSMDEGNADDNDDVENISAVSSNNMSMDETIAAAPSKSLNHPKLLDVGPSTLFVAGLGTMNLDKSAAVAPSPRRHVLQPIHDADEALRSNFLSPQMSRRNSLTSTPVTTPKVGSVVLSPGGVTFDEERSPGQLQRSLKTVRKMVVPTTEAEVPSGTNNEDGDATGFTVATADSQPDFSNASTVSAEESSNFADGLPAVADELPVVVEALPVVVEALPVVAESEPMDVSVISVVDTVQQNDRVDQAETLDDVTTPAVAEVENEVPTVMSRKSLSAAFRQTRRGTLAPRGGLQTIGETSDAVSSVNSDIDPLAEVSTEPAPDSAGDSGNPTSRRTQRRSLAATTVSTTSFRCSPAARLRQQTLRTITPRKMALQRRRSNVVTSANAATGVGTRRRSMAAVVVAAMAAAAGTAPNVLAAQPSTTTASTTATARRRSVAVGRAATASTQAVVRTSQRRSVMVMPRIVITTARQTADAATSPATEPVDSQPSSTRNVLPATAAAVLAAHPPVRRRTSLRPMTPGRRITTSLAPNRPAKTRTPQRPRLPPVRQPQEPSATATNARPPPQPLAAAISRRRTVLPPAPQLPPPPATTNYYPCSRCDKSFLQPSRLQSHMRTHATSSSSSASAAATARPTTCVHCHRTFDKPIALNNHLLEHCTKISSSERRKLQPPTTATAASSSSLSSIANDRWAKARARATSSLAAHNNATNASRVLSPSRAHRGVFQTPNKLIKCDLCPLKFGDPVSFALHARTHRSH